MFSKLIQLFSRAPVENVNPQAAPKPAEPADSSEPREPQVTYGIDVSHYQGEIDWDQVKQNEPGIAFVYIKATQSGTVTDSCFGKNWSNAKQAGILRGAYHFFNAAVDAKTQADFFMNTVGKLEPNDLPPWLDLESGQYSGVDDVSPEAFVNSVFTWLEEVEKVWGIKPVVYASPAFMSEHLGDERFAAYPLAVAQYNTQIDAPQLEGAWQGKSWTFWQYSENGTIKGINGNVDLDRYNGPVGELLKFAEEKGQ